MSFSVIQRCHHRKTMPPLQRRMRQFYSGGFTISGPPLLGQQRMRRAGTNSMVPGLAPLGQQ
jgi:hypothetical protein